MAALNGGAPQTVWEIYKSLFLSVRSEGAPPTPEATVVSPTGRLDRSEAPRPAVPEIEINRTQAATSEPTAETAAMVHRTPPPPLPPVIALPPAEPVPASPMPPPNAAPPPERPKLATPSPEEPKIAARPPVTPGEIVVKGQDPFSICGYGAFQATIASGGSAVVLTSRNRQLPDSRISGWEKIVDAGATTRLFDGCEVTVDLKDLLQGKIIVIRESVRGGDRT